MRRCCLILFTILILAPTAHAVVIYVPQEQPTIQAGIDAAHEGDIVNVVDGIYFGPGNIDLDFKGKAITFRSGNGPDYCVIEPQYYNRAVRFRNGEGRDSVLEGFTIRQGISLNDGAAILVGADCSPTITGNVFSDNICIGRGGYSMVEIAEGSTLTLGDVVLFDAPHFVYGALGETLSEQHPRRAELHQCLRQRGQRRLGERLLSRRRRHGGDEPDDHPQ
jgi:hypothetical protein